MEYAVKAETHEGMVVTLARDFHREQSQRISR